MSVVIVGDLHMSSGLGDRHECFRDDDAFARFLDHVAAGPARRLIILGDVVDFLNVRPDTGTSAASAIAKLERVAAGHRAAFRALGDFAARRPVSIVLGNHDVELAHRAAQDRFRELVGRPEAAARIRFHPWMYYERGVVYAEHGSQYHDLNAFASVTAPVARDSIELPLGSHLTRYLIELAEALDPHGTMRADPRELVAAWRAHPALVARPLRAHLRFVRALVTCAVRSWKPRRHRARVLHACADEAGLSGETLAALDGLAALAPLAVERRALRTLFTRRSEGAAEKLEQAALAVHTLLDAAGVSVPAYVFGHTHRAEVVPLAADGRHRYVNCGTWSSLLPRGLERYGDAARFTFVELAADRQATLRRWNDAQRRAEPYVPPAG